MARAAKKQTVIEEVSDAFEGAVDQAEKALNRGWEVAFEVLPERAEKLVRDFTKRTRKVSSDLEKRRKQALKRLEKTVGDVEKQGKRITSRAEKRIGDVVSLFEKRIDSVVSTVEKNVAGAVRPVAERLDIASRAELTTVKRRLTAIEKSIGTKATKKSAPRRKTSRA